MPVLRGVSCVAAAVLLAVPALVSAQQPSGRPSRSAPHAAELVQLLDTAKLTSMAAQDADHYVAALYIPGRQLLVVRGRFSGEHRMSYLLSQKSYVDAYQDLSGASDPGTRTLFTDLDANGLQYGRERDRPFDIVTSAGKGVSFDRVARGDRDTRKDEYGDTFDTLDQQYADILRLLVAQARK